MALELIFPKNKVKIEALEGDITSLDADVIVNSANTAMVLGGKNSVASRINEITEGRLEEELADSNLFPKPIPFGEVCVTGGDLLPCKYVFHLSTHGTLEEMVEAAENLDSEEELPQKLQMVLLESIREGIQNLLDESEEHELESISFPLIGSGTLNLPKPLAIEVLVGSLTGCLLQKPPSFLKKVQIVTPEDSVHQFLSNYLDQLEPLQAELPSEKSFPEMEMMMEVKQSGRDQSAAVFIPSPP